MQKFDAHWKHNDGWKARYSKLYSSRCSQSKKEEPEQHRISFLVDNNTPYSSLLMRMRNTTTDISTSTSDVYSPRLNSSVILQQRSPLYSSFSSSRHSDLGGNETLLLDMVRARHRLAEEEAQDQPLELPRSEVSEDQISEACVHGLSMRMTERSISRSRVSRLSTRRDMDIPSILAFNANLSAPIHGAELLAFPQTKPQEREEAPRWSIRRSVCPVCSQKWKDKSSIKIVKPSGRLRRQSSLDLPSVIAPARLRTSITIGYVPRPTLAAVDEEAGIACGGFRTLRSNSTSWQLTRARRFRAPKLRGASPGESAPPGVTAATARMDLDSRVNKFLSRESIHNAPKIDGDSSMIELF